MTIHIHTQGRFNKHTACSLYRILVMEPNVVRGVKMGNIAPGAGMEPRSLAFLSRVLTITPHWLLDVTIQLTPTCICSSLVKKSVQTTTI